MSKFTRYAVYVVPDVGSDLARFGASWLGWDNATGQRVAQPDVDGLAALTRRPRKYGFHGTMKPPFALADGVTEAEVVYQFTTFCQEEAPAQAGPLTLAALGSFFALVPTGDAAHLARLAASCVIKLDKLRAPLTPEDRARRRPDRLTFQQQTYLDDWGYPFVLDAFRFHMTLTGPVPKADRPRFHSLIDAHLPAFDTPFRVLSLALLGERPDGYFEVITQQELCG